MTAKARIRALRIPEGDGPFVRQPGTWKLVVDNGFDDGGPTWTDVRYYEPAKWAFALRDALRMTGCSSDYLGAQWERRLTP